MNITFLYTFPQWFVFAALFMVIYGWVENKKAFRLIGISIFIVLGIFSIIVLVGDYLAAGEYLSLEEITAEELDDEILNEIPIEAKLLPGYLSFIIVFFLLKVVFIEIFIFYNIIQLFSRIISRFCHL